jgi:hypothetical protein
MTLNQRQAKEIIRQRVAELGLPAFKLTAKRVSCIFVRIHGWQPNSLFEELRDTAIVNGFRIEA